MERWRRVGVVLGLAWAAAAGGGAAAHAQPSEREVAGTLFVRGEDGVPRPALALATDVEIRVSGLVARVVVSQRFHNEDDRWLDGTYVFPLPEMAAVDRMVLQVGERRIEGVIRERAEAARRYEQARREGRAASLLEQERPNLFTMSVANIGPGEEVDVEIEYQQTVRYEAGVFELRFPMTLTARYVPGGGSAAEGAPPPERLLAVAGTGWGRATRAVPDAARITPPLRHPDASWIHPLSLRAEIDAGLPLARVESPSHAIAVSALANDVREVRLTGVPADRELSLRWAPEPAGEPRAAIFAEERDGEHYALVMLLPPDAEAEPARLPREAVFVIDTSGSMGGASIEQARAALHLALDHLDAGDRFEVIAFDDTPRRLFGHGEPATAASVRRAHAFVDALRASGGTEMGAALRLALHDPRPDDARLRQVVFITDGSIGNEEALFAVIERDLGRSRLFTVGIGSAPNGFFLNRAATFGRGTATRIGSGAEVRERMEALFRKIGRPVLSDLTLHWNDEVETWPERVPDLYAGEPVLVAARLPRFVGELRVTGERGGRRVDLRLPLTPGAPERGIHKLWARRKIAHWMGRSATGAAAQEIREAVLAIALDHQLVSRFTSLVAVDVTPRRPAAEQAAHTNVPNHGPAGFDPALVPGVLPRGATPAPLLVWIGGALWLAALALRRGARA